MTLLLLSAFTLGMMSTLHCITMCGGIAGALTASLDIKIRLENKKLFSYIMAYNLGRIVSYAVAGAIAGTLGYGLVQLSHAQLGHTHSISHMYLNILSSVFLFLIALHLMGLFPRLSLIQKIGQPLWRYIEPASREMLPVKTYTQAFVFGLIWGWLPCAIVYSTLIWALMAGASGPQSMTLMFVFGLGTLPFVLAIGFFATSVIKLSQRAMIRRGAGAVLIGIAVLSFYIDYQKWL